MEGYSSLFVSVLSRNLRIAIQERDQQKGTAVKSQNYKDFL